MPEPQIHGYLHNKVASGHRVIYLSAGVGESRSVRPATHLGGAVAAARLAAADLAT